METLFDTVAEDIKKAMKEQDKDRLMALRMLKSSLIENKTSTSPKGELDVLVSHFKKIKDSLEAFPPSDSNYTKLQKEMEFLKVYMPQELSEEEVVKIIDAITSTLEKPNMGLIMKELTPQIKGRFDAKRASALVQTKLSSK